MKVKIPKHTILIICIIFFIVTWLLLNDSFVINRDEMYYASYSTAFTAQETKDIRYITDKDHYTVAMLPLYRIFLRASISIFGENIFGLRVLNLIAGIIMLLFVWWWSREFKMGWPLLIVFTLIFVGDPKSQYYLHHGRPDFLIMALAVCVFSLFMISIKKKKDLFLYIAGILAGISCGIYWNGISLLIAFSVICLFAFIRHIITLKNILFLSIFVVSTVFFAFILPLLINFDTLISLMTNVGFQTKNISSGTSFINYPINFINMLLLGFGQGVLILHLLFLIAAVFLLSLMYILKLNINADIKNVIIFSSIFILFYLLTTAFRGDGGGRFIDFIYPILIIVFSYLFIIFINNNKKKILRLLAIAGLFILAFSGYTKVIYDGIKNNGQTFYYQKYAADLNKIITKKGARVFLTFDFMWTLPDNPKLYLEVTKDKELKTYQAVENLFDKYNVEYVLVDERSKDRMHGPEKILWYSYWEQVLNNRYNLIGTVENKFYRENKEKPPANGKDFVTEIWERNK